MRKAFPPVILLTILCALITAFSGCADAPNQQSNSASSAQSNPSAKIKIGISMATLLEERWQRDKDAFEKRCRELQVECVITVANNNAGKQQMDVDNLLTQNINALIIIPHDATSAVAMVDKAKARNIPVVSYDRLINSDKIDLYVSHQVPVIGRKMAEYALRKVPKGNYVMVYGGSTDNNAHIMKKAQLEVLQPAVDRGDVKIVAAEHATDWKRDEALKIVENALTKNNNQVDAVIASNDGTASGAIAALDKKNLSGKVLVTGQDAEKVALQSIAEGKQTMTVYKPIIPLATAAVEAAVKLAKKEPLSGAVQFRNDVIGREVPAILLEVIEVDKDNLMATVIKDGYATYEDVYKNVPAEQRPAR